MWGYALRRVLVAIILVWVVATIVFSILHLIPGDPAELLSSSGGVLPPPEAIEALRREMGLDRPILDQYLGYLGGLLTGDLGRSFQDGYPVANEIATRLPRTLELIVAATLLSVAVGLPLGAMAARRQGGRFDRVLSGLASLQLSMPVFVIGTLLVLVFAQTLRWVPAGGYKPFAADPWMHLVHLSMPAFTIAVGLSAVIFRMARATVIETLGQDWVRTARAKGLPRSQVMRRHVVRNALGPVLTVVGLHVGTLLGGTVLVEYVFNWPGLSGFLVNAVEQRDYPAVQSIVLVISFLFILINLCVDLLYSVLDPRIGHG
ncbi:MAG: ABC transporter permease [Alphaproteobacteria bacterium]|nr:MAG: ABC transporter permease [Alphaproteobacteria bacterium]